MTHPPFVMLVSLALPACVSLRGEAAPPAPAPAPAAEPIASFTPEVFAAGACATDADCATVDPHCGGHWGCGPQLATSRAVAERFRAACVAHLGPTWVAAPCASIPPTVPEDCATPPCREVFAELRCVASWCALVPRPTPRVP